MGQNDGEAVMENGRVGIFTKIFRREDTIGRAIESILNQTYQNLRYYVLVNDATRNIVEQYAKSDERLKVVYGVPGQDSSFITYAKTVVADGNDYVACLDADDWYERNWLEVMIEFINVNGLDVAACGSKFVDTEGKILGFRKTGISVRVEMEQFPLFFPEMYQFCRTTWGKLYSKQSVMSFNLGNLPSNDKYGGYGGDTITVLEILKGIKSFGVCEQVLHNYQISVKSSSYMHFTKGRLQSDEFLFHFAENFLRRYGQISARNELFLYCVYHNAVKDTVHVVQKNTEKNEQAHIYQEIFCNELTKKTMILSAEGKLSEKPGEFAGYMTKLILKSMCYLDEEQARNDILFLSQLQRKQDVLMQYILQNVEFVRSYSELVSVIAEQNYEDALKLCWELLKEKGKIYQEEELIEILLDLAALSENQEYFVLGKRRKLEYLIEKKDTEQAEQEYRDLVEMGVPEEELSGYISE